MILQRIWIILFSIITVLFLVLGFSNNNTMKTLFSCDDTSIDIDICTINITDAIAIKNNINYLLLTCLYAFIVNLVCFYTILNNDSLTEKAKRFRE